MKRHSGPYYVGEEDAFGREDPDIINYNQPPNNQPGLWCDWEPTEDGSAIRWNEDEKFYCAAEWMQYLIDHFLKPGAEVELLTKDIIAAVPHPFVNFTFDHVVNGQIDAQGEDPEDRWLLIVEDNVVKVSEARYQYGTPKPVSPVYR